MSFVDRVGDWGLRPRSTAFVVLFTLVAFVLALALRFLTDPVLPTGFPYLTFFPAVILTGFFCGTTAGTCQAVLSGLSAWFFFLAPTWSFNLNGPTIVALLFYIFVVATDLFLIELMRRGLARAQVQTARAARLADTNRLMFHELQHRVSNNLQVVASLLKLQRRDITDDAARAALDAASARIAVVGKVQRLLHDPGRQQVDLSAFLRDLVPDVLGTAGMTDRTSVSFETTPVLVDSDAAIPLALVCAEVVANAAEHGATEGGMSLRVRSGMARDGMAEIEITDSGPGLPEGFVLEHTRSLGLRIARQFAAQAGGSLTLTRVAAAGGTRACLQFPYAGLVSQPA